MASDAPTSPATQDPVIRPDFSNQGKRAQALSDCQKETLKKLAEGAPLREVLEHLLRTLEHLCGRGMLASILLLDETGRYFQRGIGASLPEAFHKGVEGVEVASLISTCCYAVANQCSVVAPDVATDSKWIKFAQFLSPYGLRAAWSTPIFSAGGEVLGTFANYYREPCDASLRDVELVEVVTRTAALAIERRMSEQKLEASEKRYRELLDALPMAVYTTDAQGRITLHNHAAAEFAGRSPEVGKDRWCVTHRLYQPDGSFLPHDECPMAVTLLTGEAVHGVEAIAERPDGTRTWFVAHPTVIRSKSGEVAGGINVLVDITKRKQAEEALRDSETLLKSELFDMQQIQGLSAAIISEENTQAIYDKILDAAVAIMQSDFASMQMLYPERGSGGELCLLANRGFSPEAARLWEWVRADSTTSCGAALRSNERVIVPDVEQCEWIAGTDDLKAYRQTGIRAMQTTPLISRGGKLIGMVSTHWREPHWPSERRLRMLDIVARQAADLIERKLAAERQKEAEIALRKSEKFAAAGRMAATIAHEINNPLEAMLNLWYLLGQEVMSAEGQAQLKMLGDELSRVSHITKQTLEFYREGKTAGPLNLMWSIEAAIGLFSRKLEARRAKIETDCRISATLFGFAGELRQVFANLIDNSLEAGASSVKIRISAAHRWADTTRAGVRVTLSDNGPGVPADAASKLFEPFFTTKEEKGTGLGLWVSKGIVEKHDGSIHMRSSTKPGRSGTTFSLFLPMFPSVSAPSGVK